VNDLTLTEPRYSENTTTLLILDHAVVLVTALPVLPVAAVNKTKQFNSCNGKKVQLSLYFSPRIVISTSFLM
jgi:hypothetical protein